jgi:hypothetical protein
MRPTASLTSHLSRAVDDLDASDDVSGTKSVPRPGLGGESAAGFDRDPSLLAAHAREQGPRTIFSRLTQSGGPPTSEASGAGEITRLPTAVRDQRRGGPSHGPSIAAELRQSEDVVEGDESLGPPIGLFRRMGLRLRSWLAGNRLRLGLDLCLSCDDRLLRDVEDG